MNSHATQTRDNAATPRRSKQATQGSISPAPAASFISHRRNGFTLVEMLVVASIIVLMMALAVPAYRLISGSRSTEMAYNKISAMLSRARNEAIVNKSHMGVVFFRDVARGQTAMMIALISGSDLNGPTAYQAWTTGVQYKNGDRVYALIRDGTETNSTKFVVRSYICKLDHTSAAADYSMPASPGVGSLDPTKWDFIPYASVETGDVATGIEYLPPGVGCQLINDTQNLANMDKYLQTGVVVIDEQGKMITEQVTIRLGSTVGAFLQAASSTFQLNLRTSQQGVVLFETSAVPSVYSDGDVYNAGGFNYQVPALGTTPSPANEATEETWIQNNAQHLMINHNTGTLMKVQ